MTNFSEAFKFFFDFWMNHKAEFMVVFSVVATVTSTIFQLALRNRIHLYEDIADTKKKFDNRTFSYLDGKLKSITSSLYHCMLKESENIVITCPNDSSCKLSKDELHQQLMLYRLMLRDIFLIEIKNWVTNMILDNGYHDFSNEQLDKYYHRNGKDIHEWVTLEVGLQGLYTIPELLKFLGKGEHYSERQAIDALAEIIKNDLDNFHACNKEIDKLKKNSLKFWQFSR